MAGQAPKGSFRLPVEGIEALDRLNAFRERKLHVAILAETRASVKARAVL